MPSRPVGEQASGRSGHACRIVERSSPTLRRSKTQLKCQSLRPQGALRSVRDFARKEWLYRSKTRRVVSDLQVR
jgi:hypothetical protein